MLRRAVCLLLFLIAAMHASAQRPYEGVRQPRILLLVDGSSSMLQPWSQKANRFQAASNIILSLMDSIYAVNEGVEFGLRVYGHQTAAQFNDCRDTKREVMFSKNNYTQMGLRLASIRPFGVSPIAYSLSEAAENDLEDDVRNAYSIILLTDGSESCGGDICGVVETLIRRKIYFKPYIISLVDYAPLRQQYACLGSYLQVAKQEDIPSAIHAIVDAYRPQLSKPIMTVKTDDVPSSRPKVQAVDVPKTVDVPKVIDIPKWIPERSTVEMLSIRAPRWEFPVSFYRPTLRPVRVPGPIAVDKPLPLPVVAAASLTPLETRLFPTNFYRPNMRRMDVPGLVAIPKPLPEPIALAPQLISRSTRPFQTNNYRPILFSMAVPRSYPVPKPLADPVVLTPQPNRPGRDTLMAAVRPTPTPKRDTIDIEVPRATRRADTIVAIVPIVKRDTIVAVRPRNQQTPVASNARPRVVTVPKDTTQRIAAKPPTPKPATPKPKPVVTTNKPTETPFVREAVETPTKETTLSVLFTDGRGKFYNTTPKLQLVDAVTGKEVKSFHRTVDASGNPDPQTIPAGTYNLLVEGRSNLLMRRVTIEASKDNRIMVKVNNGSLRFRYEGNEKRAMTEFEAIVNIRFEPGPTIRQRCTAELEYPPGNYYVEVNTLPITRFNTDIDFGAITQLEIREPGFVQFTNTTPKGRVQLFHPLGNRFVRFYDVNVTGSVGAQKVMLQPGAYEAHWVPNPNAPFASEKVEKFVVRSNETTSVELP